MTILAADGKNSKTQLNLVMKFWLPLDLTLWELIQTSAS